MTTPSAHSLPRCPVEVTLSLISSRWVVLILRELIYGTRRFGQIRKALGGVSTKVLTQNLRTMEENGLLTRETFAEVPPRVEYTLTALGQSLRPVLLSMGECGLHKEYQQNDAFNGGMGLSVRAAARASELGALRHRRGAHSASQGRCLRCFKRRGR